MTRIAKDFVVFLVAVTIGFAIVYTGLSAVADAHRIPKADAQSRWYFVFNSHCGNGDLWVCRDRDIFGSNGSGIIIQPVSGYIHRYRLWYDFKEEYVPLGDQRVCEIAGDLVHTTVQAGWTERCGD